MLLEFACKNHRSIRKEVLFSAIASKDTTHIERTAEFDSERILKTAVIYGANGSGKSNFIEAISYVRHLVVDSINIQPGKPIPQMPHKLEGLDSDSEYKLQFLINGVRYAYGFTVRKFLIEEEYLYYFPNKRPVKIFERNSDGFTAGSKFRGKFSVCNDVLKPNRLMLSCAANFSNVPETDAVYRFFDDYIVFYKYDMQSNWMGYTLNTLEENPDIKEKIINFMRRLSINIKDIEIGSEEVNFNELDLPDFLSDELRNKLLEGTISKYNVEFVYDQFRTNLEKEESSGICKLLGFLGPLLDIIENNKVLICDELEQSLHESVLYELVKLFIELSHEKNCQMFFSTHDTSLLNLDLFRRDQIWFTELKKEDRSTDLYSLAEIKNVRKDESFRKGYISGKYGAIPMLNADIADRMNRGE
jgi:AAA15 family ATPase/GTPase